MGIRDVRLMNKTFTDLKHEMELMRETMERNSQTVGKINQRIDEVKLKEQQEAEEDWAEVKPITLEDRHPMIKTSEPGINIETRILMKKLDII